jgi:hypothetical protein
MLEAIEELVALLERAKLRYCVIRLIDRRDIEELRELFGEKLDEAYVRRPLRAIRAVLTK